MLFQVADNPSIKRSVQIHIEGSRPQNLTLQWQRVNRQEANRLALVMAQASAHYVDEQGEAISLTQAAKEFVALGNSSGNTVSIPILHDWVTERDRMEIMQAQNEVLRALFCGEQALLEAWDLKASKDDTEGMPLNDATFDLVFDYTEFFTPVWEDLLKLFNELATGKDQEKNSKPSGGAGRNRSAKASLTV